MRNVIVTGVARADLGIVDQLAALGVATVHEAIGRAGYLGPGLRPIQDGTRVGGTAVTALCWPGDNLMIHAAVEQCRAGDLLVVTAASACTDGMFGELLATSLAARGVRGLVIEAGVRDVAELRAMGFGVWSAAVSAQGTVKETPGSVNLPVSIGGQVVRPGDAIIADDDGVVCVPRAEAGQALAAAQARVAKEEQNRKALADGQLGLDLYGLRDKLATFSGADGVVDYDGDTAIAGVPGTAAAVVLDFAATQGSATGAQLPTGHVADVIGGMTVTCIDNGMPVVVVPAAELGRTGYETVAELEADTGLGQRVRALQLAAGQLMGLGDVSAASVPKISLVAAPADGGTICTRTFIPVRVHDSIGVLGAVSVAAALLLDGAAGGDLAAVKPGQARFDIEHPTGHVEVEVEVDQTSQPPTVLRSGVVRTARKLFDGTVFPRRSL